MHTDIESQNHNHNNYFKNNSYLSVIIFIIYSMSYFGGIIFFNDSLSLKSPSPDYYPLYFSIFDNDCNDIRYQIWRLESYSLVHSSFTHYFCNFLLFAIYSNIIERMNGHYSIIAFFYGIFFGALSFVSFKPYNTLIGSSGGVYAIFGSYLSSILINFKEYNKIINIIMIFNVFLVFFISIIDFIYFYNENIGYEAHLFGFISGHLISIISIKPIKSYKYHKILKYYAHTLNILLLFYFIYNFIKLPNIKNKKYENKSCYNF